jgi:3-hydroxybutyryl-CoA dehydrogenase
MGFEGVGVVGSGIMGRGIAEIAARAGLDVLLHDVSAARIDAARRAIDASLQRAVTRGKLSEQQASDASSRLRITTELAEFADREIVVEAVVEDEAAKLEVFAKLDRVLAHPDAILCSNTSSIPIMKLAMATQRRDRVVGLHFFNPVPVLELVELIPSLLTSETTIEQVRLFATEQLGKHVIASGDRAGFVVNALLVPYLLSAIRMLESGFAAAEDIDEGMVRGAAHPMGPLALTDLIGLDTTMAVATSLYEEFKEPLYAPPPLLSRMVDAGLLGRKTRRGFYNYGE